MAHAPDFSALGSSWGHQTTPLAGGIDRSATATAPSEIDPPQPWRWQEPVSRSVPSTGVGAPLLTVAGLIWGMFSAKQIDMAATGDSKAIGGPVPGGDPKPAGDAMQTAQNKPPDALK